MRLDRRIRAALVATALLLGRPATAWADDAPMAESLFQQGVAAMAAGDYARACGLLEDSQRLDPGGGTLLNLALCHERAGKLATAWARFHEALGAARRDGRADRIAFATEHIEALEPRLPRVAIVMTAPVAGARAKVDGVALAASAWETPSPIDPGEHVVGVDAPARAPWSATITVSAGQTRRVRVPLLAPAPHEAPAPGSAAPGRTQRLIGWSATGIGATAVLTAAVLGALAIGAESTADAACPGTGACADPRGLDASDRAHTFATGATFSAIGGLVALAGGIVLLVTAPSAAASER